jgi:HK97 family phage prohead protease
MSSDEKFAATFRLIKELGFEPTRKNYIEAIFLGDPPDPWTPEDEADLPESIQDWTQFEPLTAKQAQERTGKDWDEGDHPRDDDGKFTDGGGGGGGGGDKPSGGKPGGGDGGGKKTHPGPGYSASAYVQNGVIHTTSVYDAQRALHEDKPVELDQPEKVSILLQRLGDEAKKMIDSGGKAPNLNLCNVTVTGTSLFCADTKGIPRVEMPQLDKQQTIDFQKYLKKEGYKVKEGKQHAAYLHATQNELNAVKVAGVAKYIEDHGGKTKPIMISKDNYILDGHHAWAGKIGLDAKSGKLADDKKMDVIRVNIGITKLLALAEKFTGGAGHKPASESTTDRKSVAQIMGDLMRAEWLEQERKAMPMKPHADENQTQFMARCVPIEIGTGADKRPQDQAVAICMDIWKNTNKALVSKQDGGDDEMEPEDDESYEDFMDRCGEDLDDDQCQVIWDNKSATGIKYKVHAGTVKDREFILSDETPDRMDDVIMADGWDLANFRKNPIALFGHRSDFPIGRWKNLQVVNKELRGKLELAPEGTSDRIDEIRKLIDADILRAVSVGFRPIETQPRKESRNGFFYTKAELVETSLVSVPANPNALAVAKSLKISPATIDIVFAVHGRKDGVVRREVHPASKPKRHDSHEGSTTMLSFAQRITAAEQRLVALRDKLAQHYDTVDDTNVTDEQVETANDLNQRIVQEERGLNTLRDSERNLAASAADDGGGAARALVIAQRGNGNAGNGNGNLQANFDPNRPFALPRKKFDPIDLLVHTGVVQLFAHRQHKPLDIVMREIYGDDDLHKAALAWTIRASTAAAMTNVTGWAAELSQQTYTAFMDALYPKAIFPRLSSMGLTLSFGQYGKIIIPTRATTPTIAGSFVGEGLPIPVRQGLFSSQTLTPKKMAVITSWTRELDEHSVPAIEGLLRSAIQEDTAISLDAVLLDANAATVVRPAGILNGVAGLTPVAGGGFNALVGDIKQISGALLTGTKGNVRAPAWLMNPQQVNSAGLVAAPGAGVFPFRDEISQGKLGGWPIIDSGTVPLGTVIAIDAADFVSVGGEAPRFEISDQATLHFEDTAPLDITASGTPAVVAAPVKSMWQTDSLALRLILPTNWTIRRAGVVAWVAGVTW